jgi:hypothetical protein
MSFADKIMIIRQAETLDNDETLYGVMENGTHNVTSLSVIGWQRAGALATLFAPSRGPLQHPALATPHFLIASAIPPGTTERPKETLEPLSRKLSMPISASFLPGQEKIVASEAMARYGVVLISWGHQGIPLIANKILGSRTIVPQTWPENRFDLVWIFDWYAARDTYVFSQLPQQILGGDQTDVIKAQ